MKHKRLFLLVEGNDDERFFSRIVEPELKGKYNSINLYKYTQKGKSKIKNLLKSIEAMSADYLYARDINRAPCVSARKTEIQDELDYIDKDKIIVVIKEIESWYLAGLDSKNCKQLRISDYSITDDITKEQFNDLIPKKFSSRIDFMLEVLKLFCIETASNKNKSFKYFFNFIKNN